MSSDYTSYDAVVCGAGPSGWIAAVSAAREGAKVALIERLGFFGGTATANYVVPISGFFKSGRRVIGGIPWEFIKRMEERHAAQIEFPKGHVSVDPEYYKLIAQRMVLEAGVDVYTNSCLIDAECSDKRIQCISVFNKSGKQNIYGKMFIDATGDGDLCSMVNAPMIAVHSPQPLSLCFVLSNVDSNTALLKNCIHHNGLNGASCNIQIQKYLNELHSQGEAPQFGGPWFNTLMNGGCIAVNITRNDASSLDNRAYSKAEFQLREDMFTIVELLRTHFPEFKNCTISSSALNAGIRESRHLQGLCTMTEKDFYGRTSDVELVALAAHPMDIHVAGSTEQILKQTKYAGNIPYGVMVTDSLDNLIVSGRLISADKDAYASIRVQGTCMAIGEAAGIAAALCGQLSVPVSKLVYSQLKARLTERGVILT